MEGWENFFLGQVGASAALGGLLFVAVSLNLTRILSVPGLPERALLALVLILAILVMSSVMLIPRQPTVLLGLEILLAGIAVTGCGANVVMRSLGPDESLRRGAAVTNVVLFAAALLPLIVGAVAIIAGDLGSGLYLVAAGIIMTFVKAVLDAWVLLVEINR